MANDLLSALTDYLKNAPAVQATMTNPAGRVAIFDEVAITGGDHPFPYAVIAQYDERDPGESLDDGLISLTLAVFHDDLDALRTLATVLKATIDSPAINRDSTRTVRFAWAGGQETGVVRYRSRPHKTRRPGPGGVPFVWREDIDYEFTTTPV